MRKISKEEYEKFQKDHEEGCKVNDYSRMIMMGDEKDLLMRQYLRDNNLCKHPTEYMDVEQGGQIETCRICGKTW